MATFLSFAKISYCPTEIYASFTFTSDPSKTRVYVGNYLISISNLNIPLWLILHSISPWRTYLTLFYNTYRTAQPLQFYTLSLSQAPLLHHLHHPQSINHLNNIETLKITYHDSLIKKSTILNHICMPRLTTIILYDITLNSDTQNYIFSKLHTIQLLDFHNSDFKKQNITQNTFAIWTASLSECNTKNTEYFGNNHHPKYLFAIFLACTDMNSTKWKGQTSVLLDNHYRKDQ